MVYKQTTIIMKKIIFALIAFLGISIAANAQQRVSVGNGVFIATYGNVTVIENDNTQQTIRIKVAKKSDTLYDILCGDTVVKQVAKEGIKEAIAYVVQTYTTIPRWITKAAIGHIVNKSYDSVCNYYGN